MTEVLEGSSFLAIRQGGVVHSEKLRTKTHPVIQKAIDTRKRTGEEYDALSTHSLYIGFW